MKDNSYVEPIIIENADLIPPVFDGDIYENREKVYFKYNQPESPKCSIVITGYNRLNKTKYCVECVLKYCNDINYELILIDNGSSDETYEYFQSVKYKNKVIIKIEKNIGALFPFQNVSKFFKGKYYISLPNDVYLTKNALSNLLFCLESDPAIGNVAAMSSNVSGLQQINLEFGNFDEMQEKAAAFNQRDPSKWEERMRLISTIFILKREIMDVVGISDSAFIHDFSEDDLCARIRRAGYKNVLCGDTWICHDHDVRNLEDKDPVEIQKSIDSGKMLFKEKYYGLDAWDDIVNFERTIFSMLDNLSFNKKFIRSLTIDGRAGTPVLEVRNHMRKRGLTDVESYAFTTQPKYYLDLQTVAEDVQCDRIDFIQLYYTNSYFDIIAICEPINVYPTPIALLQKLYDFLQPDGVLLFKLRNTDDFNAFLRTLGMSNSYDSDLPSVLPLNEVEECLKLFGGKDISIIIEQENLSESSKETLFQMIRAANQNVTENNMARMIAKNYVIRVVKG